MYEASDLNWFSSDFAPCDLEAMNDRTAMLTRIDNKYIVQSSDLEHMLAAFSEDFDILEIGDRRAFTYATRYFDDEGRRAYYEHHQGKRKGFKVRTCLLRAPTEAAVCQGVGPRDRPGRPRSPAIGV